METLNLTGRRGLIVSIANEHSLAWSAAQHLNVALSVGVQGMARADLGGAGVMFSIDTETGFDKVVLINAAWGLEKMSSRALSTQTSIRCSSRC